MIPPGLTVNPSARPTTTKKNHFLSLLVSTSPFYAVSVFIGLAGSPPSSLFIHK